MKKALSLLLCAALMPAMLALFSAAAPSEEAPMLNGMFIAPQLTTGSNAWNENDWNTVMSKAKSAGIGQIVMQFAMRVEPGERIYYYPKSGGPDKGGSQKVLPAALKAAKANGVKLWVGLHINETEWFSKQDAGLTDTAFLDASAALDKEIFDEVWSLYQSDYADTIHGWYLTFEYNNSSLQDKGVDNLITRFYAPVTNYIKSKTPGKPILCSPLVYTQLVNEPTAEQLVRWKNFNRRVFAETRMDIIAPQDGCGWESTMKENLPVWYKALQEAAVEAQPERNARGYGKALVFNNPEAYNMNGTSTMTMKRFTDNMKAVAPYVEGHISFSIHSFLTLDSGKPGQNINGQKYLDAYAYYAKNKKLASAEAPAVTGLKAAVSDKTNVALTFERVTGEPKDRPVAGYYVFRKDKGAPDSAFIRIREIEQPADGKTVSVTDYNPGPGGEYVYRVTAFDAFGNQAKKPAETTAAIGGQGIALNRKFGAQVTRDITVSHALQLNASVKSGADALLSDGRIGRLIGADGKNAAWLMIQQKKSGEPARFALNVNNPKAQPVGFAYLSMLNQPTLNCYLPERIDVVADGEVIAVSYPLRDYYDYPLGDIWVPVDFGGVTKAKTVQLVLTMKYPQCGVSEARVYAAQASGDAGYREPVNLAAGQPVSVQNYYSYAGFAVDHHIEGVKQSGIDVIAGKLSPGYRYSNESYATLLLTRPALKTPYISWGEDSAQRSAWMKLSGLGDTFDLTVSLNMHARIQAVETEWLQDRASAVFLPSKIEVYGLGVGEEVLLGTMQPPSTALLDFDKAPSASNRHRVEAQSFLLSADSGKLFTGVRLRVYPKYPANAHFLKSLIVY